jgi:hypothetical protein
MRLPKGVPYKFISTKTASIDSLLTELSSKRLSGFIRISVERDKKIEDGYLLLKSGELVAAEFLGRKTLYSKKAQSEIKRIWKLLGIVDVYKFSDFQTRISIEENERSLLIPLKEALKENAFAEGEIDEGDQVKVAVGARKQLLAGRKLKVKVETPEDMDRRQALLKKLGLKEPEEHYVDSIVQGFKLPSERELNRISRNLKVEMLRRIKKNIKLDEIDLYINSAKLERFVEFYIDLYVKPFNKKIESRLKVEIGKVMAEKLSIPYTKNITIIKT